MSVRVFFFEFLAMMTARFIFFYLVFLNHLMFFWGKTTENFKKASLRLGIILLEETLGMTFWVIYLEFISFKVLCLVVWFWEWKFFDNFYKTSTHFTTS